MSEQDQQIEVPDDVLSDGTPVPPGRSVFDPRPDPPPKPWQPPTDEEQAQMQAQIGQVYADWSAGVDENPPEMRGLAQHGDGGEYPPFSYLFDADGDKRDALRQGVLDVVRPDAGAA